MSVDVPASLFDDLRRVSERTDEDDATVAKLDSVRLVLHGDDATGQ